MHVALFKMLALIYMKRIIKHYFSAIKTLFFIRKVGMGLGSMRMKRLIVYIITNYYTFIEYKGIYFLPLELKIFYK